MTYFQDIYQTAQVHKILLCDNFQREKWQLKGSCSFGQL